ncbi:MAG TPA: hypothetical protein VE131_13725, partial [Terriglobales bacterium]|nr:hypothetical protein [Terriglobales bacterium]
IGDRPQVDDPIACALFQHAYERRDEVRQHAIDIQGHPHYQTNLSKMAETVNNGFFSPAIRVC